MKALFDTSTLVAAMVAAHPDHDRCRRWLARVVAGEVNLVVASHTISELFALLSTLRMRPRLGAAGAWQLIEANVLRRSLVVGLSANEQIAVVRSRAALGLAGGVIYDALIARVAWKAHVDVLLTLNGRDFRRAWPEGAAVIQAP